MEKKSTPIKGESESKSAKMKIQSSTHKHTSTKPKLSKNEQQSTKKRKPKPKKVVKGSGTLKTKSASVQGRGTFKSKISGDLAASNEPLDTIKHASGKASLSAAASITANGAANLTKQTIHSNKDNQVETDTARVVSDAKISWDIEGTTSQNVTANAINDAATLQDEIGFEPYVNALSKMIVHKNTQTPLVIGLYGPWGSGKTSFMKQVDAQINKNELINNGGNKSEDVNRSIFFEAWQYQNTKNLSGALLFDILKELENKSFWRSAFYRIKNAFRQFNVAAVMWNLLLIALIVYFINYLDDWMYLAGLPLIGLFLNKESHEFIRGLKVPMGIDISKLLRTNDDSMQTTALHDFKPELERVINSFVPKGGRLVLYIDDLDRCVPSQVVSILETLSVLFESDKCVFVLGIDRPKVIRAIEAHYEVIADKTNGALEGDEKKYGEAFLEKIIQLGIVVPVLNSESIAGFANSLIAELSTSAQETSDNSSNINSEVHDIPENDIEYDQNTAISLKDSIMFLRPSTPRSIKRFLNRFRFIYLLWSSNRNLFSNVHSNVLPVWLLLNELFPQEISTLRSQFLIGNSDFTSLNSENSFPEFNEFRNLLDGEDLMDPISLFIAAEDTTKQQYFNLVQNIGGN